ncbi:MAG: response regulator [Chloroflexota bacterium]
MVDDEQPITAELAPFLQRSGFEVLVAHDGEEALAKAQSLRPDVLVLDIIMPGLDGREVCRQLQGSFLAGAPHR